MDAQLITLRNFPKTKKDREVFVAEAAELILSGEQNPLEYEIMLKNLEETIKDIRKNSDVKSAISNEAYKYHEKTFEFKGAKITKTQRTAYDFASCEDSTWEMLQSEKKRIDQEIKDREAFLKAIKYGMEVADVNTGAIIKPANFTSTEFLTIKLT